MYDEFQLAYTPLNDGIFKPETVDVMATSVTGFEDIPSHILTQRRLQADRKTFVTYLKLRLLLFLQNQRSMKLATRMRKKQPDAFAYKGGNTEMIVKSSDSIALGPQKIKEKKNRTDHFLQKLSTILCNFSVNEQRL